MASEIVPFDASVAVADVKRLANLVLSLRDDVFKEGLDFGRIPGTGDKPTLLLPGMEKLLRALHLRPEYVAISQIEDFDRNRIFYRYECRLIDYDTGLCVSTAIGSANSYESKWRWRDQKRSCPKCGKETINKSKFPPKNNPNAEPGWYCHAKAGGCGAEFAVNDPAITEQVVGRIENPDIFDQMNTIDKIAQKRALSSAIKGAANVSEFFTVDLEDFVQYDTARPLPANVVEGSFSEVTADQPSASVRGAGVQKPTQPDPLDWTDGLGAQVTPLDTDTPPNTYTCDCLKVHVSRTATTFLLMTANGTNIVAPAAALVGLQVNGMFVEALAQGVYPLSPAWTVQADRDAAGNWENVSVQAPESVTA